MPDGATSGTVQSSSGIGTQPSEFTSLLSAASSIHKDHISDTEEHSEQLSMPSDRSLNVYAAELFSSTTEPTRISFGWFQWRLFFLCGLGWAADNAFMAGVANVVPVLVRRGFVGSDERWIVPFALFLGMTIGSLFWGLLGDRRGRRVAFLGTMAVCSTGGAVCATALNGWMLAAGTAVAGFGVGGSLPIDGTMLAEFLPSKRRGGLLTALSAFWGCGAILAGLVSFAVLPGDSQVLVISEGEPWRVVFAALTIMTGVAFLLRLTIPESPLWLAKTQKYVRAAKIMVAVNDSNQIRSDEATLRAVGAFVVNPADPDRIAIDNKSNRSRLETFKPPLSSLDKNANEELDFPPGSAGNGCSRELLQLFSAELRKTTLTLWTVWAATNFGYTSFALFLPSVLSSDDSWRHVYLIAIAFAAASIPGSIVGAWLVETRLGRKYTLVLAAFVAAASVWIFRLASATLWIAMLSACVMNAFAQIMFAATFTITPELFPTAVRGTGVGASSTFGKLAGTLAPLTLSGLVKTDAGLLLFVCSLSLVIAGCAALLLPRGAIELDFERT